MDVVLGLERSMMKYEYHFWSLVVGFVLSKGRAIIHLGISTSGLSSGLSSLFACDLADGGWGFLLLL